MTNQRRNAYFFFVIAAIGLVTAWTFKGLAVTRGENYIADGFTTNVDWVYSLDLLIGGVAGMAFIIIEGRRLGMRRLWVYIALSFITAFAFVFPLFLGMRALRLEQSESLNQRSKSSPMARTAQTKNGHPPKVCERCGLPFEWRKKWERDWANVKYCSQKCKSA